MKVSVGFSRPYRVWTIVPEKICAIFPSYPAERITRVNCVLMAVTVSGAGL